jgi:hypothetical protein
VCHYVTELSHNRTENHVVAVSHNLRTTMEAATKITVTGSILAAALLQNFLVVGRTRPWLSVIYLLVLGGSILGSRLSPRGVLVALLGLIYLIHAVLFLVIGDAGLRHFLPLSLALLGLIVARPALGAWNLPPAWKPPLVFWALVLALSWPVVFLRELDFSPGLTLGLPVFSNGRGVLSEEAAGWVLHVVVIQGVGLLWIDWLWGRFRRREEFERLVIRPLAAGFLVATLVAFCQAFIDIRFLNPPHWIAARRASGALMDGNHFGILAACWGPALAVLLLGARSRHRVPLAVLAAAGLGLATVVSGSTSSLFIVVPCTILLLWLAWRARKTIRHELHPIWSAGALVIVLALAVALGASGTADSFERVRLYLDASEDSSVGSLVSASLRDRPSYARIALHTAAEYPFSGVGPGSFNTLSIDLARRYGVPAHRPFENALNWFLHQLAELGLLGSVGWLGWIVVFATLLVRQRAPDETRRRAAILKCLLITFGVASLFGVHAQSPEVLFTFWTFVFWLCLYLESPMPPDESVSSVGTADARVGQSVAVSAARAGHSDCPAGSGAGNGAGQTGLRSGGASGRSVAGAGRLPCHPLLWAGLLALALVYVAAQGYVSARELRVPNRAARDGWSYEYGFYGREEDPERGPFRWTGRRAVAVVPVSDATLALTVWALHPDIANRPVDVKVWAGDDLAVELRLGDSQPVKRAIPVPGPGTHLPVTVEVSRTWRPAEHGRQDTRRLGLAVSMAH